VSARVPGPVERVVFFGGGGLMFDCARQARAFGVEPTVVAAPRHLRESVETELGSMSLSAALKMAGIFFLEAEDLDGLAPLRDLARGRTLGLGFGEVYTFSAETLELFDRNLYDFMVIPLPLYRGGAHFTWQILRGDRRGGWCVQEINEEMVPAVRDTGAILMERNYLLPATARIPADYFEAADREGSLLFGDFLRRVQAGEAFIPRLPQERASLYFPRLHTLTQGWIDWSWSAGEIERFICAFDEPYAGASTTCGGSRIHLKGCRVEPGEGPFHPFMAGLVFRVDERGLFVAARDEALVFERILSEEGEDLRGCIPPGSRFATPSARLEEARGFEAIYDARGLVPLEAGDR